MPAINLSDRQRMWACCRPAGVPAGEDDDKLILGRTRSAQTHASAMNHYVYFWLGSSGQTADNITAESGYIQISA